MYYLHSMESIFSVVTGESGLFLIINLYLFLYLPCFVEYAMLTGKPSITYCCPVSVKEPKPAALWEAQD